MGVIHKITPEIKEFVVEKKRLDPVLSCRSATALVREKFQIKLSKSSANAIFKECGLSLAVGRRRKLTAPAPKPKQSLYSGVAIFKAADSMFGGCFHISEAIKRLSADPDALIKTEGLFEAQVTKALLGLPVSWPQSFAGSLNRNSNLLSEVGEVLKSISRLAVCVKAVAASGKEFYLDSRLHTLWQSSGPAAALSCPAYNLEQRLEEYAVGGRPFVLFFAPGFHRPLADFFDFLKSFSVGENGFSEFILYAAGSKEIKRIKAASGCSRQLIFGIWPWQFKGAIELKVAQDCRQLDFAPPGKQFFLSPASVRLAQETGGAVFDFSGCLLKTGLEEKTGLLILSNVQGSGADYEAMARSYLECWPAPADSFQAFSRRIEASAQKKNLPEKKYEDIFVAEQPAQSIDYLLDNYLKILELYVKEYFLPHKYSQESQSAIKDRFYLFELALKKTKDALSVKFNLPPDAPSLKDIDYTCNKVNASRIIMPDGRRLWMSPV